MRTRLVLAAAMVVAVSPVASSVGAQNHSPLIGRWDLVVGAPGASLPAWLEVRHSGSTQLIGQVMIVVGSARPIAKVAYDSVTKEFSFTVPPQWNDKEGDNTISGKLSGDSIRGVLTYGNGKVLQWSGVRAPTLRRTAAPVWGAPIQLLNGKDVTGWKALDGKPNQWVMENGVLKSPKSGANLATERTFKDFKLHLEFRYPAGSNSGIYLRGRYEVQVEDTQAAEPQMDGLGAVYGLIAPNQNAAKKPGEWQTYDITLVGRTVTVVLNGKVIICEREIPGPTGGALDSDEAAPGPIYLQGDHGPIEYRNIVITPAK